MAVTILQEDGTEKELDTVPSYEEKPVDANKDSGFYGTLKDFMETSDDNKNGKDKGNGKVPIIDNGADSNSKEQKADDIKKLLDGDKDDASKARAEDGVEGNDDDLSASDKGKGDKGKSGADQFDELAPEVLKIKAIELNAAVAERDSKVKELETNFQTAQAALKELQKDGVGDPEIKEFLKGIRTDFAGTLDKFRKKYELPDNNTLLTQLGGGLTQARNARLKQYIDADLRPKVEKDFNLEKGTFKFNEKEAWDNPESASYAFRKGLETKEGEFENADKSLKVTEKETYDKMLAQQEADRGWFAEKYCDNDKTKVQALVDTLNTIPSKIASGELKPEDHPLSLRYILRGYYYDDLVEVEKTKVVENLKKQLKDLGAIFPEGKEFPTDVTKVKQAKPQEKNSPIKIKQSEFSPMAQSIESTINS